MKKTILTAMVTLMPMLATAQYIHYPKVTKDAVYDDYFGTHVEDPYRWMEDDNSAQTKRWVEAENQITSSYLESIPFRSKLLKRLKQLAGYDTSGAPFKRHGKWYVSRHVGLQNQSVIYQMDRLGGEMRVFLDPNKLSADGTVALKGLYFSHNGRWAAYSVSRSGSDWQEFYVIDMKTGKLTNDHIQWAKFSEAAWVGDGFYYSAYDAPTAGHEYSNVNESHKIYYHKIGTPQSEDVLYYHNPAYPKRFYNVSVNDEETMLFLYESGDGAGNNLFVHDLRKQHGQLMQMTSVMDYDYSPVMTEGDRIFLYTNYGAPKGRLMVADVRRPGINNWQELVPERREETIDGITAVNRQFVIAYNKDASSQAFVYDTDGKQRHQVSLPALGTAQFYGDEKEPECFYTFTSFTQPVTVFSYDIARNKSTVYYAPKVAFRAKDYVTEQVFFPSKDGTCIPMFLTYKKGLKRNGKNPVYLYGYGGFNISLSPNFTSSRIPFLEQGGIYAQATLRGGGEYGEKWHLAGTKMQKQNVFDDFIGAAEWLILQKYTSKDRIAIVGGSNGGLLVGACMTQRPDLFRVAVPQVGVMDMLRYHKFTIGWNWASDYGTSEDSPEMFRYLYGYSPLHNLKPGVTYPATLVTTADHDDRVVPAHSFKFAATLQECHQGLTPVLIRIDTKAGHGSGKPLAKVLEEQADIYSFIMYNLGMKYK